MPPDRAADAQKRLQELGLKSYGPLRILEKTKGRLATDLHWLQTVYFDTVGEKEIE